MAQNNCKCNNSIKCSVNNCAYHNNTSDCCSLESIRVGCCGCEPTNCAGTECASFKLDNAR